MGNPITKATIIGTIGELLVQLRLLEYGVQAAPPIKDSGNDLIAIKGEIVKFVQVKTFFISKVSKSYKLPKIYHIVCLVKLKADDEGKFLLDKSTIIVSEKDKTGGKELDQKLVDKIWGHN